MCTQSAARRNATQRDVLCQHSPLGATPLPVKVLGPGSVPPQPMGLGGMGSLCANELFLNNDLTWFRE